MSAFVAAMDSAGPSTLPVNKRLGENFSPEYTADGVGDPRVAIFFSLVRKMERDRLVEMTDAILATGQPDMIADAFVLAFQTRHCRGGKGERLLFYWMIIHLYKTYPLTVTELLPLIPVYGSFKDWFCIAELGENLDDLKGKIVTLAAGQLRSDLELSSLQGTEKTSLSLLAKWAPREKRAKHKLASSLAKELFPGSKMAKQQYRKLVSTLNKALNTTEIKMCANEWSSIQFSAVPSRAMLKYRKAFLNEKVNAPPSADENETGNRFPTNEDRVACRKRLREEMIGRHASKLKGKQLFPHEIVAVLSRQTLSVLEQDLLSLQWNDIRRNVKESMSKQSETKVSSKAINLGKVVAIADVSGSMSGTPMMVSIALSILVSELAAPEFADRFITFSERPTWVQFEPGLSLEEKVNITMRAPWGMNTNFEKVMDLILDVAASAKLSPSDIPDLIVFSDMQFDQASQSCGTEWDTAYERLAQKFAEVGVKVCGSPWNPPHITFWNLRGDTIGFPAQQATHGVTMLSGFSPSLLQLLLSSDDADENEEWEVVNEEGAVVAKEKTPYEKVRKMLDSQEYNKVREILGRSTEGLLNAYTFETLE